MMSLLPRQQRGRGRQYSELFFILIGIILSSRCSYQQDDNGDGYDDEDSSYDDTDETDDCSLISGHTCTANGICKYCAMCLQSSCILSKSISPTTNNESLASPSAPVCNTTQFGSFDIYDWYGYCLSSGNDSDGDYCATSSECYQYRKNANSSISYIWKNLTCEPTSCLLMTDRGLPPPAPGQLPPDSDNSNDTAGGGGGGHRHHSNDSKFSEHSPSTIALTVTCSFIFLVGLIWITRLWMQSRKRRGSRRSPFSWFTLCGRKRQQRVQSLASDTTTIPSTAPPSFSSNAAQPEMQQRRNISNASLAGSQSSQQQQHQRREPLPSYYSPDPPPPKYEQAIVTQIRGLMARGELDDGDDNNETGPATTVGHNSLPPPLWLPVYFTPNHSAYSFGRLRRHPPPHVASPSSPSASSSATPTMESNSNNSNNNGIALGASSSSNPYHHDLWNHNNSTNRSDLLQAFWYHHQQQIGQPRPSPSTSSPAAMDVSSTNNRRNNNQSTDHESNSDNDSSHQDNNSTLSSTGLQ
ncbi:hypothetical protein BDC45DRAFT_499324 [Circinella umbellata]|nr:hypothetical protein BDC45DRAFT_499324 [Circinella umbellata]